MTAIPGSRTLKHRIGAYLHRHNGATVEQVVKGMSGQRGYYVKTQLAELVDEKLVFQHEDGMYRLSIRFADYFDMLADQARPIGNIVESRTPPEFRPIQSKNQFWNNPRFERRDICFKTAGAPALSFVQPV